MCYKNRGLPCSTCHKPAPYHRRRCPAKHTSNPAANTQHDGLPTYTAVVDPQPPTTTPLPFSAQARCGGRGYGECGYPRRHCRGPVHLLVSLVVRKVQEKKERVRPAATFSDGRESEVQERGVVEAVDEKWMEQREVEEEKRIEDVKVLTKSVRGMSL